MEDTQTQAAADAARFAGRVREFRLAKGWTQGQLAERMTAEGYPMHQTTIAKLEQMVRPTTIQEAAALAIIFGVEVTMLIGPSNDRAERRWQIAELEGRAAAIKRERALLQLQGFVLDNEEREIREALAEHGAS